MTDAELRAMTPLQRARYYEAHPEKDPSRRVHENCDECENCVEIKKVFYCEITRKNLIPKFMHIGRCMHVPSNYKQKEEEQ